MSETSNYLSTRLLDHVLNGTPLAQTQLYIALSTSVLSKASTGATIAEPTWPAYARVAINFKAADLSGPAGAARALNDAQIDFTNDSGGQDTIVAAALVDSVTPGTGNIYYFDNEVTDVPVADGGVYRLPIDSVESTQA